MENIDNKSFTPDDWSGPIVTASTMITQFLGGNKVGCHNAAVDFSCVAEFGYDRSKKNPKAAHGGECPPFAKSG